MRTPAEKMNSTNVPPLLYSETIPRTSGSCSSTALLLDALGQHAGALLVENLHDILRQRGQQRTREQQRDRDTESEHRGDHGLADTRGHELRIGRARLRDA